MFIRLSYILIGPALLVLMASACSLSPTTTQTSLVASATAPISDLPTKMPTAYPIPVVQVTATPTAAVLTATAPTVPTDITTRSPIPAPIRASLDQVEEQIIGLRGLAPAHPIERSVEPVAQLQNQTLAEFAHTYSTEAASRDTTWLWLMRLGPRDHDLRATLLSLYRHKLAAYYDYQHKILFISSKQQVGPWERSVYAHELVHALQDQHYDLTTLLDPSLTSDEHLSRRALVEGDAMLVEGMFYWQYLSDADRDTIAQVANTTPNFLPEQAPPYISAKLDFPYTAGVDFTMALWRQGRWEAVNAAFADPPVSSEQILHPEKYFTTPRDLPLAVSLPALGPALGPGWTEVLSDTIGEFDLRFLLQSGGANDAEQAAAGWGGGRYTLWQHDDQAVTLIETRWDSQYDADEFFAGLGQTLATALPAGELFIDDGRYIGMFRRNDRVVFVSANTRQAAEYTLAAARKSGE